MNVLGIETSCDETAAAVVSNGSRVLSNVVLSQANLHEPYGGVVPEIASRSHEAHLPRVLEHAVSQSGMDWSQLDAIAVTYGPGLASSLLVGLSAAKALALRLQIPLVGINHLEAHLYSTFLSLDSPAFPDVCPFVALIASGGHTCLLRVDALGEYRLIGTTLDDAAGEAFDKGAHLLGLGYPGGPAVEKTGRSGQPGFIRFPRGRLKNHAAPAGLQSDLCFSFSGLKTALLYYLKALPSEGRATLTQHSEDLSNIAASYQEAIVDALVDRVRLAVKREDVRCFSAIGGVSLNSRLREKLKQLADSVGARLLLALPDYCVDNAAMVAGLAAKGQGISEESAWLIDASPNLEIGR